MITDLICVTNRYLKKKQKNVVEAQNVNKFRGARNSKTGYSGLGSLVAYLIFLKCQLSCCAIITSLVWE